MLNTSVLEFPAGNFSDPRRCFPCEITDELPDVPALPETLLTMEFQLQENSVDLRRFTEVVLADLGATVQILRLAGQEYRFAEDCPVRIEDCIADLGLRACFHAAAGGTLGRGSRSRADFEFWTHSREIARRCRLLAEEVPGSFNPDRAYLGGLLHALGALPDVLGWEWDGRTDNGALSALKLAEQWRFPQGLRDFYCDLLIPGQSSLWSKFLVTAHQETRTSWARCPLDPATKRSFA